MKLSTRRTLYIITILLFIFLAPALFLYGIGYRYNSTDHSVVQTGGIFIHIFPDKATVTVNHNKTIQDNPARVRYLRPGLSHVHVAADGYLSADFDVNLDEAEVVVVDPLELLPKEIARTDILQNVEAIATSPFNDVSLAFSRQNDFSYVTVIMREFSSNAVEFSETGQSVAKIVWGKEHALLQSDDGWFVLSFKEPALTGPFTGLISPSLNEKTDSVTYSYENNIYRLDLGSGTNQRLPFSGSSYYQHGTTKFLTITNNDSKKLIALKDSSRTELGSISKDPYYFPLSDNLILLQSDKSLLLVDTRYMEITTLSLDAGSWIYFSDILYFSSGSEVWKYNTIDKNKQLINRFTSRVQSLAISPMASGLFIGFSDSSLFWYLTTPSPASVEIKSQSTLFQRIDSKSFRKFSINQDGKLTIATYSI